MLSIHHFSTNNSFYQYSSYGSCLQQFWKMFPPHKAEERAPWPSGPFLQTFLFLCKLPHQELFNSWKTYGDILKLKLGLICTIVISSPHMAIEVLKRHHQVFASCLLLIAAHSISSDGLDVRWVSQRDTLLAIPRTKAKSLWAFVCQLNSSKNVWRWRNFILECMSVLKRLQG
jgi:hypothetical protein